MAEVTAATISPNSLAACTGFSVSELADLAQRGYFPKARADLYDQDAAVAGCFKACQDRLKEAGTLPLYESMAVCTAQTGIPRSVLKAARKQSPESFRGHRIPLGPLLKWIFSQNDTDGDWSERLKRASALREEIRLAKDKQQALDKGEAATAINQAVGAFFATIDRYSDELPAILHGMDAAGIKEQLSTNAEALKTQLTAALEALTRETKIKS